MNGEASTSILEVRLSAPTPARSMTIETKSGTVRWALLEDTLVIQPEKSDVLSDPAHVEHLVRTVMRRSGLAKRYHVFTVTRGEIEGSGQTRDR